MADPTLSVVVPTLNAAATLRPCLTSLGEVHEIIVADGGSTDATASLAVDLGARLVEAPRGRGHQLHAGAALATGDWLLFLHADTRLGDGWQEGAGRHMTSHPTAAACFTFRLDHDGWQARLLERGVALRVRALALPYGDQGLLLPRALYEALGGFRPLPLMEDVDLVRRLGRRRLRLVDTPAITSAARWHREGWWRRSACNLACLTLYGLGVSPVRIARLYG